MFLRSTLAIYIKKYFLPLHWSYKIQRWKVDTATLIFTSHTHACTQPPLLSVATATQHSPAHLIDGTSSYRPFDKHTHTHARPIPNLKYNMTGMQKHTLSHLTILSSKTQATDTSIRPDIRLHLGAVLNLSHPTTDAPVQTWSAFTWVRCRAEGLSRTGAWR